jgi:hypothetical protein
MEKHCFHRFFVDNSVALWITFVGWALQALQALIARASTQRLRAPETMRCRVFKTWKVWGRFLGPHCFVTKRSFDALFCVLGGWTCGHSGDGQVAANKADDFLV